mgnify:FL=1
MWLKLDLGLDGLAARQLVGLPKTEVEAWFWFVDKGDLHRGGLVDLQQEQRLKSVLDVVVGGIRGGIYPANPGNDSWFKNQQTWENCSYCPFDLVCPTTRVEQWNELRKAKPVSPYAELVNPSEASA